MNGDQTPNNSAQESRSGRSRVGAALFNRHPTSTTNASTLRLPQHKVQHAMAPRFMARQFSNPAGIMGRVIGSMMNRYSAPINEFALRHLEIRSQDRILEIGFGGGLMLRRLISANTWVTGIDRSTEMVRRANSEFRTAVKSGRAVFDVGSVEALPYEPAAFNKVSTVNTIYFWNSLESGLKEIHRVLAPGGRAAIGFLPEKHMARMNMPRDIYTLHSTEDVIAAAREAGFSDLRVEWPDSEWNVVIAHH